MFPTARVRLYTAIGSEHNRSDDMPAFAGERIPDVIYPRKNVIFETNENLII